MKIEVIDRSDCEYNVKPYVAGMITWGIALYLINLLCRLVMPWNDNFQRVAFSWAVTMPMIIVWLAIPGLIGFLYLLWYWAMK